LRSKCIKLKVLMAFGLKPAEALENGRSEIRRSSHELWIQKKRGYLLEQGLI